MIGAINKWNTETSFWIFTNHFQKNSIKNTHENKSKTKNFPLIFSLSFSLMQEHNQQKIWIKITNIYNHCQNYFGNIIKNSLDFLYQCTIWKISWNLRCYFFTTWWTKLGEVTVLTIWCVQLHTGASTLALVWCVLQETKLLFVTLFGNLDSNRKSENVFRHNLNNM